MAISGFNTNTAKHLMLDAGAWFKDYDLTKTYAANVAVVGCLLGATQGGGSFSAVPTVRKIEIDGVKGSAKGMQTIDEWVVTMVANVKEITADNMALALGAANTSVVAGEAETDGYTKVTAKVDIEETDYLDNITWVGRLSGAAKPVIIVIKNALSINGLSLTMADKSEANVPITVTGHYDASDLDTPPFEILYPPVV